MVAAILANVQAASVSPISNLLAKALVVHSAALRAGKLPAAELNYRGFGIPTDASEILRCETWMATLVFETKLVAGIDLQRVPFAIPDCLRLASGAFRAEVTATLAYDPPLDAAFGAEYCRSNVELSLGTHKVNAKGKLAQGRQLPPFPKRSTTSAREKKLIENGFKWSPVKVYRRAMPKGVSGDRWRMTLAATDRSGFQSTPIPVALVVTVSDIERSRPVYNDMVKAMAKLGWATSDLTLKIAPRLKP